MTDMKPIITLLLIAIGSINAWASGRSDQNTAPWQTCTQITDTTARLVCFDQWAANQTLAAPESLNPPAPEPAAGFTMVAPQVHNCKQTEFSELSRFWELEAGSDCGTFGIRGYKPISLAVIGSDSVNLQPTTPAPQHTVNQPTPFKTTENRFGLSVRTKVAQGLLTQHVALKRDSVWFAYSQQSNWQLFSAHLSRPFRTTDHEPELIYIYPTDAKLSAGWRLRYTGISLNHQSNGQSLPLSRSWNRVIAMAGMEKDNDFTLTGKLWYRLPEAEADDDNPDIADLLGRIELAGQWNVNLANTLGITLRHSQRAQANGSVKLEWLRKLGDSGVPNAQTGLRFHTQLFSGYGDSLIDYNRRRTVLSVGLSLVDW